MLQTPSAFHNNLNTPHCASLDLEYTASRLRARHRGAAETTTRTPSSPSCTRVTSQPESAAAAKKAGAAATPSRRAARSPSPAVCAGPVVLAASAARGCIAPTAATYAQSCVCGVDPSRSTKRTPRNSAAPGGAQGPATGTSLPSSKTTRQPSVPAPAIAPQAAAQSAKSLGARLAAGSSRRDQDPLPGDVVIATATNRPLLARTSAAGKVQPTRTGHGSQVAREVVGETWERARLKAEIRGRGMTGSESATSAGGGRVGEALPLRRACKNLHASAWERDRLSVRSARVRTAK